MCVQGMLSLKVLFKRYKKRRRERPSLISPQVISTISRRTRRVRLPSPPHPRVSACLSCVSASVCVCVHAKGISQGFFEAKEGRRKREIAEEMKGEYESRPSKCSLSLARFLIPSTRYLPPRSLCAFRNPPYSEDGTESAPGSLRDCTLVV